MSTVLEVSDWLRMAILRGEFLPGHRLRQDELAASLGVSKIPVREALQRLSAEGLVVFEPNRGSVVRALTAAAAEEIFALRGALEPLLLRRAIGRLSIVDLATAEMALADQQKPRAEANWEFHGALYRPAGWQQGLAMVASLHVAVAPYLILYTTELDAEEVSEAQHHELLQYCRDGNEEDAVRVLAEHLGMASRSLVAALSKADT